MTPQRATPSGPSSPSREPLDRGSSRPGGRRVTAIAFTVSAAVHLLAVVLYPVLVGPPPEDGGESSPEAQRLQGMELVRLAEVPAPEEAPPEPLVEPPAPREPIGPSGVEVSEPETAADYIGPPDVRRRSAAEEIRPRRGDPRLSAPLPDHVVSIDDEWLARLHILWAIEELSDSATAAAAAEAAARDWTYVDAEGRKWGVSPGKIHLGDVTIPVPFSFSAPYGSRAARQARDDAEIMRAAVEAATREVLRERVRAIRERRERERANTPPDTTGGGGRGGP